VIVCVRESEIDFLFICMYIYVYKI
jgi:hypothetical protein